MKLSDKGRLNTVVGLPERLTHHLGLTATDWRSYSLTPPQADVVRSELGLPPKAAPVRRRKLKKGLYAHQEEGLEFLRAHPSGALLAHEPGLGKTLTILTHLGTKRLRRTVIFAPLSVTTSWRNEAQRWLHMDATVCTGGTDRTLAALEKPGPWILNYDVLRAARGPRGEEHLVVVEALVANGVEHVVLDESTRVKNSRSETWKAVRALVEQGTSGKRRVESVIAASGNPMPNSPVDIWAQIRLLLGPRPLRFSHPAAIQKEYAEQIDPQWGKVTKWGPLEGLYHRLGDVMHRVRKEDALDLPPKRFVPVPVVLTPKEKKQYDSMKRDAVAELHKLYLRRGSIPETTYASSVAVQIGRLIQLTGGASVGYAKGAKMAALLDLLEDLPRPVVIWAAYRAEVDAIRDAIVRRKEKAEVVYGGTSPSERDRIYTAFSNGQVPVLVSHPRAGGIGVQLQRSSVQIWYSRTWSAEDRQQAVDRQHRIGQEADEVLVYDLLAEKTIDAKVLHTVEDKITLAHAVLDNPAAWVEREDS